MTPPSRKTVEEAAKIIIPCFPTAAGNYGPLLTRNQAVLIQRLSEAVALALDAARAEQRERDAQACPCLHIAPCQLRCTCVDPFSSSGCRRCCTYGSKEQRRRAAEHIAAALRRTEVEK